MVRINDKGLFSLGLPSITCTVKAKSIHIFCDWAMFQDLLICVWNYSMNEKDTIWYWKNDKYSYYIYSYSSGKVLDLYLNTWLCHNSVYIKTKSPREIYHLSLASRLLHNRHLLINLVRCRIENYTISISVLNIIPCHKITSLTDTIQYTNTFVFYFVNCIYNRLSGCS